MQLQIQLQIQSQIANTTQPLGENQQLIFRPSKVDILDVLQHLKAPHVLVWAVILLVVYP